MKTIESAAQDAYDRQLEREVEEAFRVQQMSLEDRGKWFEETFFPLQEAMAPVLALLPPREHTCRSYRSWEEKNAFDEKRELEQALLLQEIYACQSVSNLTK